ncbi:hypothetical protein PR202_gb13125 [Eleusine coracana subsp. coracana]|uniref:Uncharacterized protein n=1 Tax=Eleusine coracana subsp. coracana TaxID=191504 RepID=A0AAV5ESB6_ELECO|nr:hypothetical protein PR202_gb13125 [Eleusine coracana subsp. coracana]
MQEMWKLFHEDDMIKYDEPLLSEDSAHLQMVLSHAAYSGVEAPRTMKLLGTIQGRAVVILVDFGSSHTFVSSSVARDLTGKMSLDRALKVQVANGDSMQCDAHVCHALWAVQGYEFHSDLKVFPLQYFGMVLGYDWLEQFSPMQVHGGLKWMAVPYQGKTVVI